MSTQINNLSSNQTQVVQTSLGIEETVSDSIARVAGESLADKPPKSVSGENRTYTVESGTIEAGQGGELSLESSKPSVEPSLSEKAKPQTQSLSVAEKSMVQNGSRQVLLVADTRNHQQDHAAREAQRKQMKETQKATAKVVEKPAAPKVQGLSSEAMQAQRKIVGFAGPASTFTLYFTHDQLLKLFPEGSEKNAKIQALCWLAAVAAEQGISVPAGNLQDAIQLHGAKNIEDAMSQLSKIGPRAFFNGMSLRIASGFFFNYLLNETRTYIKDAVEKQIGHELSPGTNLVVSVGAGAVAGILTVPLTQPIRNIVNEKRAHMKATGKPLSAFQAFRTLTRGITQNPSEVVGEKLLLGWKYSIGRNMKVAVLYCGGLALLESPQFRQAQKTALEVGSKLEKEEQEGMGILIEGAAKAAYVAGNTGKALVKLAEEHPLDALAGAPGAEEGARMLSEGVKQLGDTTLDVLEGIDREEQEGAKTVAEGVRYAWTGLTGLMSYFFGGITGAGDTDSLDVEDSRDTSPKGHNFREVDESDGEADEDTGPSFTPFRTPTSSFSSRSYNPFSGDFDEDLDLSSHDDVQDVEPSSFTPTTGTSFVSRYNPFTGEQDFGSLSDED